MSRKWSAMSKSWVLLSAVLGLVCEDADGHQRIRQTIAGTPRASFTRMRFPLIFDDFRIVFGGIGLVEGRLMTAPLWIGPNWPNNAQDADRHSVHYPRFGDGACIPAFGQVYKARVRVGTLHLERVDPKRNGELRRVSATSVVIPYGGSTKLGGKRRKLSRIFRDAKSGEWKFDCRDLKGVKKDDTVSFGNERYLVGQRHNRS